MVRRADTNQKSDNGRMSWPPVPRKGCASLLMLLALSQLGCSRRAFRNPLFKGQDPWVIFNNGEYLFSGSYCGLAEICLKRSKTLAGLADAPWEGLWKPSRDSDPNAKEIWSPELHEVDDRWYIYYSADDGRNDKHRLYVLASDAGPQGPFHEATTGLPHGQMQIQPDRWAIDPNVFQAADGRMYLTWSCTNQGGAAFPQRICLALLKTPLSIQEPAVYISAPTEAWETRDAAIQEGPVGYTRAGHTYITYSASASFIAKDYAVGVLALAPGGSPVDPRAWTKSGPIFDRHGATYGPGSVVFVPSRDGKQDWNVYHAINSFSCVPAYTCRSIRMQPMRFDQAGYPQLGIPRDPGERLDLPSGE